MSDVERDPLVRRAIDELRRTSPTDRDAVARVVTAAAAARVTPADDESMNTGARTRRTRWFALGGVAAAVVVVGVAMSGVNRAHRSEMTATASPSARATVAASATTLELQPVGSNSGEGVPVTRQFVFHSRTARSVSVVGDFNRWNAESARMSRAADGDLWSVTVRLMPGRHTYGFMVDDSVFTLDPRETTSRDADLGVEASVIIVGTP